MFLWTTERLVEFGFRFGSLPNSHIKRPLGQVTASTILNLLTYFPLHIERWRLYLQSPRFQYRYLRINIDKKIRCDHMPQLCFLLFIEFAVICYAAIGVDLHRCYMYLAARLCSLHIAKRNNFRCFSRYPSLPYVSFAHL